jgi:hypothetical protein
MPVVNKIQFRRDTAANWASVDPVLSAGELGYESDTKRFKIGDGTNEWTALEYFSAPGGFEANFLLMGA